MRFVPGEGVSVALDHYDVRPARHRSPRCPNHQPTAHHANSFHSSLLVWRSNGSAGKVYVGRFGSPSEWDRR